jgi:hypothetical protein
MNVYGSTYMNEKRMNEKREAYGKVVQMLLRAKEKAAIAVAASQLNSSNLAS